MKLLHVVQRYWPYVGGSELYFQRVSELLAAAGHEVTVYTTCAWDLEYFWNPAARHEAPGTFVHEGVRVVRFPVRHLPGGDLAYRGARRAVLTASQLGARPFAAWGAQLTPLLPDLAWALARSEGTFDLVHAGNIPFDAVVGWALVRARRDGAAFVVTPFTHLGEDDDDSVRRFYTMPHQIDLLRSADAVFYQTSIEAGALASLGVPTRALRRGGVGIDAAEVAGGDREGFRRAHGVSGPLVYFLGTLAYDKGAQHVVEAVERLWAAGVDVSLALGGAAMSGFDRWLSLRPEATLRRVIRLGHVVGDAKRDLLAAGDIFCMPSRTDSFGIVYLEAWTAGHPVIGASAGGVKEVIRDQEDGLLVPFGDVAAIASAIAALLSDAPRARRMGSAGGARAAAEYTWPAVAGRVEAVYKDVLAR